jgi:hypothetical protein
MEKAEEEEDGDDPKDGGMEDLMEKAEEEEGGDDPKDGGMEESNGDG